VSFPFNSSQGPITVIAEVSGPTGRLRLRLLLDTGATTSSIIPNALIAAGYDPDASTDRVQVTMGGGTTTVPRVMLNRLTALGKHRIGLIVTSYPLPPGTGVHGLLGLDFFRGHVLTLDFCGGLISLA
jgi:predicted aspartyl protease